MKKIKLLIYSVLLATLFFSCAEEDSLSNTSVIKLTEEYENELDVWIRENITEPYNIMIKYKYDRNELENNSWLVPPKMEKAKLFCETFLSCWIKPYAEEAGVEFIKKYCPKLLVLCGTPAYNGNATMVMGFAEGGRKVAIFDINSFGEMGSTDEELKEIGYTDEAISNLKRAQIEKAFHTMHHEFAHILHQTKQMPLEFQEISKGDYTVSWINYDDITAQSIGFVTAYGMSDIKEDWVETVATILDYTLYSNENAIFQVPEFDDEGNVTGAFVELECSEWGYFLETYGLGYSEFWGIIQLDGQKEGKAKFLQKVELISNYYKDNWNLDLFSLQKRIELALIENIN